MSRANYQTRGVLRLAGSAIGGQAVFTFMAIPSALNKNIFIWPWWPAILGMLFAVAVALALIMCGLIVRRASYLHACSSLMPISWAIVLLGPSYEMTATGLLRLSIILFFMVLNCAMYFNSTTNKLARMKIVPMLDPRNGKWDLNKSLATSEERARGESLAKILIPLGPIAGTLLYHMGASESIVGAILPGLACLVMFVTGINLSIVNYLSQAEQRLGKVIRL